MGGLPTLALNSKGGQAAHGTRHLAARGTVPFSRRPCQSARRGLPRRENRDSPLAQRAAVEFAAALGRVQQRRTVGGDSRAAASSRSRAGANRQRPADLQTQLVRESGQCIGARSDLPQRLVEVSEYLDQDAGLIVAPAGQVGERYGPVADFLGTSASELFVFTPMPTMWLPSAGTSTSTPASLRSPTKTSFGQCSPTGCRSTSGRMASTTATPAARATSGRRRGSQGVVSGESSRLKARQPGPVHQRFVPRPRPRLLIGHHQKRRRPTVADALADAIVRRTERRVMLCPGNERLDENALEVDGRVGHGGGRERGAKKSEV